MKRPGERKLRRLSAAPLTPGDPRLRPKGRLILIGGREDTTGDKLVLRHFVRRAGTRKIAIATIASEDKDRLIDEYARAFRSLGVRHVHHLRIDDRDDARSPRSMKVLQDADAVFFTGGDQLKITSLIGGTPAYWRIFEIFIGGGTLAGTSAGAAVMTETMIVGSGDEESMRISGEVELAPGFGFLKDIVLDQHFAERGRAGRLLGLVAQNPGMLGIGIDENTAIDIKPARGLQVIGTGGVTVIDGRTLTFTNVAAEERSRTASMFGVTLHVLSQGDSFDFKTRRPKARPAEEIDRELGLEDDDERPDES